jgi:DNA invertase Pin-like site-specific DNA recombinase
VIYCRVSTKEQVEEGNSLATQERICRDYAHKNGYDIAEIFIEQGESAKTDKRTEWRRLMGYCTDPKNSISAVIAYKIDRISRNTYDYSHIRLNLKRYKVEIKSTSEYFEDTPAGRFMENIIANVAQFDNDVRTERSVGGMRDAMREGRYVWKAPIGYENRRVAGKSTVAHTNMAPLVCKAFTAVARNLKAVDEVRRDITKAGLTNDRGIPLSKGYFYRMLTNEVYAGWINKFGERHRGLFEPIVTVELFDQVQRVLKHREHKTLQYELENPDFPLRRFVFNPLGQKLTGCWCTGRNKRYPYYRFLKQRSDFRKNDLETSFIEFLNSYELGEEHFKILREKVEKHLYANGVNSRKESKEAERRISDLKQRQQLLIDKNLQGVISNELLREQLNAVDIELLHTYPKLIPKDKKDTDVDEHFERVRKYARAPGIAWKEASFEKKLKLQWFHFPKGLVFDGSRFETTEVASLFKAKSIFLPHLSPMVPLGDKSSNQMSKDSCKAKDEVDGSGKYFQVCAVSHVAIEQVATEVIKLGNILSDRNE